MIILSVGMPRAGSGWHYNLIHDLMIASGAQDARVIRQRYRLGSILTEVNCNIGALTPRRLVGVMVPSILGNTFVIKAHAGPTSMALRLARTNHLRVAYIFRDPRDAMLSAIENGQRAREKGRQNAFSHLSDFQTALDFMGDYVRIWQAWINFPQALHTRYEDLLTDYDQEVKKICDFLPIDTQNPDIVPVIEKYRPERGRRGEKGLHFSKGKIGRFREKMNPEEQLAMREAFGPALEQMGYPP